jgi:hypothetical protein
MNHLQHAPRSNTQPLAYFGSLPLLEGEDPAGYDALLARVSDAIRPTDILEEIWIQEIVALAWEAFRLRRARAAWLTATRSTGISNALRLVCSSDERDRLNGGYLRGDAAAMAAIDQRLVAAGVTPDIITARTIVSQWDLLERIDRMITTTELRRDAVLHEIERHRTSFAAALRAEIQAHAADADIDAVDRKALPAAAAGPSA